MPTESIVFAPELDERELDRETQKVNDELASVGSDLPMSVSDRSLDAFSDDLQQAADDVVADIETEMDGLGSGGGGGMLGGGALSGAALGATAVGAMGGGPALPGGGRRQPLPGDDVIDVGPAGTGGTAAAGGAGALASKIPKPISGVAASSVLPIALAGGVGAGMLSAMHSSSGALQTTTSLFGTALDIFFRPFGNFLSDVLRPFANEALDMAVNFNDIAESEGLAVSVISMPAIALKEGFGFDTGDFLEDPLGELEQYDFLDPKNWEWAELPEFEWPGLPELPEFEWPDLPDFEWPTLPNFRWPTLPNFRWPTLPDFSWPTLPKFKWPELPDFSWPELPEFEWPDLPDFEWPTLPDFSWPTLPNFRWPTLPNFSWPSIQGNDILNDVFGGVQITTDDVISAIVSPAVGDTGGGTDGGYFDEPNFDPNDDDSGGGGGGGFFPVGPLIPSNLPTVGVGNQRGSVVRKPTPMVAGEAGPEVIAPYAEFRRTIEGVAQQASDSGGGGEVDMSSVERKLDELNRNLRSLKSMFDVTVEVDGEQIARASKDGERNRIADRNPTV